MEREQREVQEMTTSFLMSRLHTARLLMSTQYTLLVKYPPKSLEIVLAENHHLYGALMPLGTQAQNQM